MLDALGLILGDASNPSAIRAGSDQALIEALVDPPQSNPVWSVLIEQGLAVEGDKEFVIRRVLKRKENEEMMVNGKSVELATLKKIGNLLAEIHGQFANQSLLDPSNQLTLLDLSGSFPPELFTNVSQTLKTLRGYMKEQMDEGEFYQKNANNIGKMETVANAIEATGLMESGIDQIRAEYARLLTAYETSEAFQEITSHLIASNGAIKSLTAANLGLARQKNLDADKIQYLTDCLTAALENAREAHSEVVRLSPEYDIDTKPLRQYREMMTAIQKVSDQIKVPPEQLVAHYTHLKTTIDRIRNCRERIAALEELIKKTQDEYRYHAGILSEKRVDAANLMSEAINALLPSLKLMRAEFQVQVEKNEAPEAWTERGFDTITFTARMNPGMPFSPITETASGGELARLVLAVKVVLQRIMTIPTLVFDEVDTGIGGAAAAAVGERIAELARTTQVMVITHSPQVASRGSQHLHVSKESDGIVTVSAVRALSLEERINEISRMLAGNKITNESHAAAKRLIEEAATAMAG